MKSFETIERKMQSVGLSQAAVDAFRHSVDILTSDRPMMIPESEISPATDIEQWEDVISNSPEADAALLAQTVIIKLNGGLGTSMGLQKAKSLLEIKPGITFLDLIVRQVQALSRRAGSPARLLLMNSFSTSADTMAHLARYEEDGFDDAARVELMQNRVPKLRTDTLEPVEFPENPDLEWCPPGHGDIYPALLGSGKLQELLDAGVKYAFVSNSDNLGAQPDTRFLNSFAASGAPFVMEVTRRTEADRKGGHLAVRKADGQPILREVAQCPDADIEAFRDIDRHRYFNTNNLWIRLDALSELLRSSGGVIPLPVIRNSKTVDPRNAASTPVYQLETAMGAAIQCFPGAKAICVPRSRFFPVKTSSDLLLLRSDAVQLDDDGCMSLAPECGGTSPIIRLNDKLYKLVDSLDTLGVPSLKNVSRLEVNVAHTFTDGEELSGNVLIG